MKYAVSIMLVSFILLIFVGTACAGELSGEVVAVDTAKSAFTLKTEEGTTGFAYETSSVMNDVKVGNKVTVQYRESGGKKTATRVTLMKRKVSVGC